MSTSNFGEKMAVRSSNRRFSRDSAPTTIADSGVSFDFWPTVKQYNHWWKFIRTPVVASEDGWWQGRCPIHDPDQTRPESTAEFNFRAGSYRCLADDDENPCHPHKSAGTLYNLKLAMSEGGLLGGNGIDFDDPEWQMTPEEQAELDKSLAELEELATRDWRRNPKAD